MVTHGYGGGIPRSRPAGDSSVEEMIFDGMPFVARSDIMRKLLAMVQKVARYPTAILIEGETGSGKELIARALHHFSLRCNKPFVDVNCAALPEHLIESELFGYEKGAFSGADSTKPGFFELAAGGTLFLDEIGELDPKMQVKLLRVLDGTPYYRLGGNKKVAVDTRIVTATNRELDEEVRSGRFRRDLFHRLNQIKLRVPPLRERPEDVEALSDLVLKQTHVTAELSKDALDRLRRYSWPGNVRELKNVVINAAMMSESEGGTIGPQHLPSEISGAVLPGIAPDAPAGDLENMERLMIQKALERTAGDQTEAAEQLGISRRTLSRKLKQYKIEGERHKAAAPAPTLGSMSTEQQGYYRASVELPVTLSAADGTAVDATTVNISGRGLGVQGIAEPFRLTGPLDLALSLPGQPEPIRLKGKMTWADVTGRAGIQFQEVEVSSERRLNQWLATRLHEEGWDRSIN